MSAARYDPSQSYRKGRKGGRRGRGETPRGWDDRTVAGGSRLFLRPALPLGDRFTATLGTDSPVAAAAAAAARRLLLSEWTRRYPGCARARNNPGRRHMFVRSEGGLASCNGLLAALNSELARLLLYEQPRAPRLYLARRARNFADATEAIIRTGQTGLRYGYRWSVLLYRLYRVSFYQVPTAVIQQ